jgi:hypothetical protein
LLCHSRNLLSGNLELLLQEQLDSHFHGNDIGQH